MEKKGQLMIYMHDYPKRKLLFLSKFALLNRSENSLGELQFSHIPKPLSAEIFAESTNMQISSAAFCKHWLTLLTDILSENFQLLF